MRVLILNQPFHPDVVATAQIAKDLADELVVRGHEVTAIASRSLYGRPGAALPERERIDGIDVVRVGANRFGKGPAAGRVADFGGYYVRALQHALRTGPYDVVVCLTTPPYILLVGLLLGRLRGTRVVYWLMDVYPDVMVSHGMIAEGGLLHRGLRALHRSALDRADAVVALGRCMRDRLVAQGADPARIHVVPVWSAAAEVSKVPRDDNPYRREWQVGDRMLVMYAGNFGLAHDVRTFLEAAARLRESDEIRFAFVGGGRRKAEVEAFVRKHDLTNCVVAPYQPRERLADLLAAADVHLVTMQPGMEGLVVPSKFYGIAGAGRPVVFVGPASSEIALSIDEWQCGARVEPGDVRELIRILRRFTEAPEELRAFGRNAQTQVARHASRTVATGELIALIEGSSPAHSTPDA